nr:hypothetical protein CKG001_23430 [Bdellovibrio sp. CKG001]
MENKSSEAINNNTLKILDSLTKIIFTIAVFLTTAIFISAVVAPESKENDSTKNATSKAYYEGEEVTKSSSKPAKSQTSNQTTKKKDLVYNSLTDIATLKPPEPSKPTKKEDKKR